VYFIAGAPLKPTTNGFELDGYMHAVLSYIMF
jgi:hypothetical protein